MPNPENGPIFNRIDPMAVIAGRQTIPFGLKMLLGTLLCNQGIFPNVAAALCKFEVDPEVRLTAFVLLEKHQTEGEISIGKSPYAETDGYKAASERLNYVSQQLKAGVNYNDLPPPKSVNVNWPKDWKAAEQAYKKGRK